MKILQVSVIFLFIANSNAWHESVQNSVVCDKFHVAHFNSTQAPGDAVSLTLWDSSGQVDCFMPRQMYTVRLLSQHDITGFLWKLNNSRGRFPIDTTREANKFVYGICEQSISHRCHAAHCNFERNLSFEVMTPKSRRLPLTFRYTVVFSRELHLENQVAQFPSCPNQGTPGVTTATSPPEEMTTEPVPVDICGNPVVNSSTEGDGGGEDLEINNLTTLDSEQESPFTTLPYYLTEVNSNCGLMKVIVNESRYYERDGINYFCVLKSTKPIKNVTCEQTCIKDDMRVFCEVKNSLERKKGFICTALSSDVADELLYIEEQFIVTVTNQCVCGFCPM